MENNEITIIGNKEFIVGQTVYFINNENQTKYTILSIPNFLSSNILTLELLKK